MSDLMIKVFPRNERGKQNKKVRKNKAVPAIVYGNGQKNIALSLDIRLAEKYSRKKFENKIFTFDSEDKKLKGLRVIKKSISYHKVNHQPIHMDFLSLDMKKVLRVFVDINFKGTPRGVKEEGGIFNIVLRNIEVECLPDQIPSSIDLDVSDLGLNQNIHVSELSIPKNIKLITKDQRTLCTLVEATEEEEEKPVEASAAEAGAKETTEKAEGSGKEEASAGKAGAGAKKAGASAGKAGAGAGKAGAGAKKAGAGAKKAGAEKKS